MTRARQTEHTRLNVAGLGYSYTPQNPVFSALDFSVEKGEILVLLGPNGSGKTTLLNCIAGLLRPQEGVVELDGVDLRSLRRDLLAQKLGYLPQAQQLSFDFAVLDYVVMGRSPYLRFGTVPSKADYARAWELLERLGIAHLGVKSCGRISGGERQQAQIARILMQDTRLILMDEPTNHLDYGNQIRTLRLIASLADEGYSIVMTSHVPDHAILLQSSLGVIDGKGSFCTGAAGDILTESLLEELYGEHINLLYLENCGRMTCVPTCIR
ncbi:MAG: ABC transporter ATP-binding protein [Coriobacteriales bacterium]|jgi:iron complex transport system ATP-binding protein|nr:ABC transporter ATP-binding protein [Coriobacteriales bacterium]